ncbi:hypothetical protein V5G24_09990 [Xanthobacter sp. VTT E-85241]|uniref:hypothetical protein n=1 Tax=Roseixanthobacter finlandensis TaxID=3119922 RepID=UPI0037282354
MPRLRAAALLIALLVGIMPSGVATAQQWTSSPKPSPAQPLPAHPSAAAPETPNQQVERVGTRFGTVLVISRFNSDDDSIDVALGTQKITLNGHGGTIQGQYRLPDEDVLIITTRSGGSGGVDNYYLISASPAGLKNRTVTGFSPTDYTFKVQPSYDSLQFDLGYEDGRLKVATYSGGVLRVTKAAPVGKLQLGRDDCASVLDYAAECKTQEDCRFSEPMDIFSMNVVRNLHAIANNPAFSVERFQKVCVEICRTRTYSTLPVRKQLCGY